MWEWLLQVYAEMLCLHLYNYAHSINEYDRPGAPASHRGKPGAGLRCWGHSAMTLTFRVVLAKWTPQDLQLGSEPVGEGKELYPGLE